MADCYEAQGNLELALETLRQMDLGDPAVQERITALEQEISASLHALFHKEG